MKDVTKIKTETIKNLARRKNYLLNQYQDITADVPEQVTAELQLIELMLTEANVNDDTYQKRPATINIRNTRDEEWYFQQMKHWIKSHPQATSGKLGRSFIYKFTLHFFVENIVLNSQNRDLGLSELENRISQLSKNNDSRQINAQNKNIEASLGFMMSMLYQLVGHMPESVDNKKIDYKLNPLTEIEIMTAGTDTDLNDNAEFNLAFQAFKEVRKRDKQQLKKLHQSKGKLYDD
ncbi:hypothetical protein [Leuconostoc pseudomesenteroides]|uniref:hypothetical protein n=1 Tax=Leuconostoc pseudomesenteroides TaxID=33968 RepID=UPI0032DE4554